MTNDLKVFSISILPLYGVSRSFDNFTDAIGFARKQPDTGRVGRPLVRLEATVTYEDGTRITGGFPNRVRLEQFLKSKFDGHL